MIGSNAMAWNLQEALDYYRRQGAPTDQSALLSLLTEIQQEHGGSIPRSAIAEACRVYGVKEGLFLALIKRIPRLRLSGGHELELCGGPNCSKRADLYTQAQKLCGPDVTIRQVPCMRQCGKGPNLRFDGTLYNQADEALLRRLLQGK